MFARRHESPLPLGGARALLAAPGGRLEGRREVGELLDALADDLEVAGRLSTARAGEVAGAVLVEVHTHGADDVVDQPALRLPATGYRLAHGLLLTARHPPSRGIYPASLPIGVVAAAAATTPIQAY